MTKEFDARSWELGRLSAHIEIIKGGVRPVALLMINKKFLDEVISDVLKSDLHGMTKECGTTHVEVYIFKDFRYKKAIEWAWKIQETFGVGPEADLIWGKIFGYSDKEIMDYIEKGGVWHQEDEGG